jgi:transglutaminase-like putative cysteine protease
MLLDVEHRLAFEYDGYIRESFLELRVQPKTTAHQTVSSFVLAVGPPTRVTRYTDWNGNLVHHFGVTHYHNRIEVLSRSCISTHPLPMTPPAEPAPAGELPYRLHDFVQFDGPVRLSAALRKFHRALPSPRGARLQDRVTAMSGHIRRHFTYRKDVTRYDSSTDDFLELGAGVCQDFAHLMLALLRLSGVPCRYVSGYLHVDTREGAPSQSHAWIEFHSPDSGWVPFDPTHDRAVDERYVVVGHGRHYDDVPPNKGIYRGTARETLTAEVRTRSMGERPPLVPPEAVQPIDLPVFREIPERRRDYDVVAAEAAAQQQQ